MYFSSVTVFLTIFALVFHPIAANAQNKFYYRVKRDDLLSQILDRLGLSPVYGQRGSLSRTLEINSELKKSDGNLIFPGKPVNLPVKDRSMLRSVARVEADGEVILQAEESKKAPLAEIQTNRSHSKERAVETVSLHTPVKRSPANESTEVPIQKKSEVKEIASERPPVAKAVQKSVDPEISESVRETKTENSPESESDLEPWVSLGYGPSVLNYKQSGSLGGIRGMSYSYSTLFVSSGVRYENYSGEIRLSRYSLDFSTGVGASSSFVNQAFSNTALIGGVGSLRFGVGFVSAPVMKVALSGSAIEWDSLTSIQPMMGYALERKWMGKKGKGNRVGLEAMIELPIAGSGTGGQYESQSISGYGATVRGYADKMLITGDCPLYLGVEGNVHYQNLKSTGTWGTSSGSFTRILQEYQGSLRLRWEY